MGQTGADFGAVSTDGLVQRVRRKIDEAMETAEKIPFRRLRERRMQALTTIQIKLETRYALVKIGEAPEAPFRAALIAVLDPQLSGGDRNIRLRW